jgi:SSS family solute:Na+ symporter
VAVGQDVDWTALAVIVIFFVIAGTMGFAAADWHRGRHVARTRYSLDEWGLGGRGFGTVSTWFLVGGTVYTAFAAIVIGALVPAAIM